MKKKINFQHLARSYNSIPKSEHQRTLLQLVDKLKNNVCNFYIRGDISYQLPGKNGAIVIEEDDGNKVPCKKRVVT